jgi:UDP-N-acetylglucosamine 2-epimerase
MDDPREYERMSRWGSPYRDGQAARRIVQVLAGTLGLATGEAGVDEFVDIGPGPRG